MRILILHNYYQHLGGEDIVVQQEAEELIKRGHQVSIVTRKNKKGLKGLQQYATYVWNFLTANQIITEIKIFKPDIVHIHNLHYAIGPLIIRRINTLRIPTVMTLHNFRLICPSATLFYNNNIRTESVKQDFPWTAVFNKSLDNSFLKSFITALTYWFHRKIGTWEMVNTFITMTDFNKRIFLNSRLNVASSKIFVKNNFTHSINNNNSLTREKHFLYIGRVSEEKGIRLLISSFPHEKYSLKIIGTGPIINELKANTNTYKNIEWLGQKNKFEIEKELKSCNALIIPSVCFEGAIPLTILEAISSKTPVIASKIGSIPDVIVNKSTGWLFDPYDKTSLLTTLEAYKNDKNKSVIVENAYQLFEKDFSTKIIIDILINTYRQAINKNE